MIIYKKIKHLLDDKKCCALCGEPLIAALKDNTLSCSKKFKNINCKILNDEFKFRIKYDSQRLSIDNLCLININSNQVIVTGINDQILTLSKNIKLLEIIDILKGSYPSIELQCVNGKCTNSYCLNTTNLKFTIDSETGVLVNPIMLDWECFKIPHFWIKNDIIRNRTQIYAINNPSAKPITTSLLNIDNKDKDKIFNKIKTIINFG